MAEDIATKKSVALKGHKYIIDTNGVTKSHTLVTVSYTPAHARTRSVNDNVNVTYLIYIYIYILKFNFNLQ